MFILQGLVNEKPIFFKPSSLFSFKSFVAVQNQAAGVAQEEQLADGQMDCATIPADPYK